MIAELGHYMLILALGLALIQASVPLIGAARQDGRMMMLGQPAAYGQFFFSFLAFLALTYSYLVSDFSVAVVARNSHSLTSRSLPSSNAPPMEASPMTRELIRSEVLDPPWLRARKGKIPSAWQWFRDR